MLRLNKPLVYSIGAAVILLSFSCDEFLNPEPDLSDLAGLSIDVPADTVLLLTGETIDLTVMGTFIEISENTITNSGTLVDTYFIDITTNQTIDIVPASSLEWYTSNQSVISVSEGKISALAAGEAAVWAGSGEIISDSVFFLVSRLDLPPDLVIDPPPVQLIFQDTSSVSGYITPGMDVTLTVNGDTADYDSQGKFCHGVNLSVGNNVFTVIATNNENGLAATGSKTIIYYRMETAGIEGYWEGETLTRPFGFEIYYSRGIYVIDGYLTVDFTVLGGPMVVENIVIAGLVLPDGTIDVAATLEEPGVSVTGSMDGYFLDSGKSTGTYSLRVTVDEYFSGYAEAQWTAERVE